MTRPQVAVIGLGFVGLTTALGLAETGITVSGFDIAPERRDDITAGKVPFHEPGLDQALSRHLGGRFTVKPTLSETLVDAQVVFLCVGTPCGADGAADLTILFQAIDEISQACRDDKYRLLVVKSTVPPGSTTHAIARCLSECDAPPDRFGLASNPEFLREGYAWDDFMHPDRIVVGTSNDRDWRILQAVYAGFEAPVHRVTPTEAEFIKYLSNTLLATMISFANEMSMLAQRLGDVDIQRTFGILHADKRWSGQPAGMASYVYPGCGYGGYCLPKDTQALAYLSTQLGLQPAVLNAVIDTNRKVKIAAVDRIAAQARPQSVIGILGLSFKPQSDDVRDSPAADIARELLARGYHHIVAHDPMAINGFAEAYGLPIDYCPNLERLIEQADVLVVATAWPHYRELRSIAGEKPIVDLRYNLAQR